MLTAIKRGHARLTSKYHWIFVCLSLICAGGAFASGYECEVKDNEGKTTRMFLIDQKTQFLFLSEDFKLSFDVIHQDAKYLHLMMVSSELSMHLGINKTTNFLILDGMDLEKDRPRNRVKGFCESLP